jgi:hypothetical protein
MRGGVLLIVVGLLLAYLAVTGRYKCFSSALDCLLGDGKPCGCDDPSGGQSSLSSSTFSGVQPLKPIQPILSGVRIS